MIETEDIEVARKQAFDCGYAYGSSRHQPSSYDPDTVYEEWLKVMAAMAAQNE